MGFFGELLGKGAGHVIGGLFGKSGTGETVGGALGGLLPFQHGGRVPRVRKMKKGGKVAPVKPRGMKRGGKAKKH